MDGARVFRRRAGARTAHVEHEDDVAGAVHARDRAAGERMAGDQALVSLGRSGARSLPRRRADLSIARAPSRVTASRKLVIDDRRGGGARGGFCCVGGDRRGRGASP